GSSKNPAAAIDASVSASSSVAIRTSPIGSHGTSRTRRHPSAAECGVTFQTLRLAVDGGVARLELNRPDVANAINLELATELERATAQLAGDPSVRAVLLTGAGARFCGGGDVPGFAAAGDQLSAQLDEITAHLHPAVETLAGLD